MRNTPIVILALTVSAVVCAFPSPPQVQLRPPSNTGTTTTVNDLLGLIPKGRTVEFLAHIIKGADVNYRDGKGKSLLHHAAEHNRDDLIALMLRHGADANVQDNAGKTPLQYAEDLGEARLLDVLRPTEVETTIEDVKEEVSEATETEEEETEEEECATEQNVDLIENALAVREKNKTCARW